MTDSLLSRRRALVVDGDESNLVLATEALTSFGAGFDVATARSADEARTWMRTFTPELVVLDEAFAEIAEDLDHPREGRPKVVLVSSHSRAESDQRYFDVLRKPFTLSSLLGISKRASLGSGD